MMNFKLIILILILNLTFVELNNIAWNLLSQQVLLNYK